MSELTGQDLLHLLFTRNRWVALFSALGLCLLVALVGGYLLAVAGPLYGFAGLLALGIGLWMLKDIEVAYATVIAVVCLLPFASFPFEIGFTPTFLDAALGGLFGVWFLQLALGVQRRVVGTSLAAPVIVFMLLAVTAFVFGLAHAPLTSFILRHFAEIMLGVMAFFLVINTVQDEERLARVVRLLLVAAAIAALLGIVLYVIPDAWAMQALSALGRLGYPTGTGVLRYVDDDPESMQRATSTSVDPNVLGSLLNVTLAIGVPQLFVRKPLIRRRYLLPLLGLIGLCLGLTLSRGSLVGVGAALVAVAALRYRKLWWLLLAALVLILILPQTQAYVARFIAGLQGADRATQMRFGEYRDALTLIGRYPWTGVGFAGSPDIDTYIGVANVYLLIAQEMGIPGLLSFAAIVVVFFARFWRVRRCVRPDEALDPLVWGLHAGIVGALTGGIFDHYFFNLDFPHSVVLFWMVMGLATAAVELLRRRERRLDGEGTWMHMDRLNADEHR